MSTITDRILKALVFEGGGFSYISPQKKGEIIGKIKSGEFPIGKIGEYVKERASHKKFDWAIDSNDLIVLYSHGMSLNTKEQDQFFDNDFLRAFDKNINVRLITGTEIEVLAWRKGEAEPMRMNERLNFIPTHGSMAEVISFFNSIDDIRRKRGYGTHIIIRFLDRSDMSHEEKCFLCEEIINRLILDLSLDNSFKTKTTSYGTTVSAMGCGAPNVYAKYLVANSDIARAAYIYQLAVDAGFEDGTKGGYSARLQKLQKLM